MAEQSTTYGSDPTSLSAQTLGGSQVLQDQINNMTSTGWISGGTITDAGSETIDIAAGEGFIRDTNSPTGELYYISWPALSAQAVATDTTRYIYVSYNNGNPIVVVDSSDVTNTNNLFHLGEVHNIGGTFTIHNDARPIGDAINRITTWASGLIGTRVASGEIVSDASPSSRKIAVTAGDLYDGFYRNIITTAFDSNASDTFTTLYRDGSGDWTRTASQTEWPNAKYDDGDGGLADMTGSYYANLWVIRGFDDTIGVMYGQAEYNTQGGAEAEAAPASRPEEYDEHGFYIAQITFQKSGASPVTITTIKPTIGAATTVASASVHNDLSGLDGGQAGQYNHLTDAEYTSSKLSAAEFIVFDSTTDVATGNGKIYFHVPAKLNGMNLVTVHAEVITAGTTNTTDIQIANVTQTADMLSTVLTVDSGETGSDTAATPAVIDTTEDDVATNDVLRVDVDAVSTTAPKGLIVTLEFQLP